MALAVSLGSLSCLYKKIIFVYNMCGFFQPEERGGAGQEMKMRRMVQEEDPLDRALCLTF